MVKKIIIMLCFVLYAAGCSTNYDLIIENDKIIENVSISIPDSKVPLDTLKENTKLPRSVYGEANTYYDFKLEKGSTNTVHYSYTHDINKYNKSNFIKYCYGTNSIKNDEDKIIINTPKRFNCIIMDDGFYMDKVVVHIKTDLKVLNNNADTVDDNIYSWVFDKDNYENKPIKMTLKKSDTVINKINKYLDNPAFVALALVVSILLIALIIFVVSKIRMKKNNDI